LKQKEAERPKREAEVRRNEGTAERKHKGYQEIIAARPAPDLATLAARAAPEVSGDDATESFWDLLKLRETKDPKAVPTLEKVLIENIPTTRIHGFAAAQALSAIGTPEALQILDRNILTSHIRAQLANNYTSHWEMKEPLRSQFIDKYLLKNLSNDLVIELTQERVPNASPGMLCLTLTFRNMSDAPFHFVEPHDSNDLLFVRDQSGQIIPDSSALKTHRHRNSQIVELKGGNAFRCALTLKISGDSDSVTVVDVAETGQHFEMTERSPKFLVMFEAQPLLPEQRKLMKVDENWPWWTGRAVSKWIAVDLNAAAK
jgi:hypothetical protein